ncbi:unnamed protein product [Porites evermanni]|uniref:Uncharacterized protein n=1 Tax=Porites evermanni TaxID=104178 RepID=A0ABN8T3R3_9CNID|nr:unnamed protein product [Porites evermanni]
MPFFKRSTKPPKRRLDAGNTTLSKSNLSLAGTGELAESVDNALVKLKLGRHELLFQDGEWIAGGISTMMFSNPATLRNVLLHMTQGAEGLFVTLIAMAASTADCNVMEKELDTLQSQKQGHRVAR